MIPLRDITSYLEGLAPSSLQESYDNSGLQVGDPNMEVSGILVALDASEEVLHEAEKLGFNLVLTHHPVIFGGLKSLTGRSGPERIVRKRLPFTVAIPISMPFREALTQPWPTGWAWRIKKSCHL